MQKIAPLASLLLEILICCLRCAGRFALRDFMPIHHQESARFAQFNSAAQPASTTMLPFPHTVLPAFMEPSSSALTQVASLHAIPTNIKTLGIIAAPVAIPTAPPVTALPVSLAFLVLAWTISSPTALAVIVLELAQQLAT